MGFLFVFLIPLCLARICQSDPPTVSLIEELRLCRELNFPFCVEATSANLLAAQSSITDLPPDVASAATSQVSAMAVVGDRYLVQRYKSLVETTEPTQTCLHNWRLAICSEMFSSIGSSPTLCYATCDNVRKHCTGQYISDACQAILNSGPRGGACFDYAALLADDKCVIGDASLNAGANGNGAGSSPNSGGGSNGPSAPLPPPPPPPANQNAGSPVDPNTGLVVGGGSGGNGGGLSGNNVFSADGRRQAEICRELVLLATIYLASIFFANE
jgi:hypothetical protein